MGRVKIRRAVQFVTTVWGGIRRLLIVVDMDWVEMASVFSAVWLAVVLLFHSDCPSARLLDSAAPSLVWAVAVTTLAFIHLSALIVQHPTVRTVACLVGTFNWVWIGVVELQAGWYRSGGQDVMIGAMCSMAAFRLASRKFDRTRYHKVLEDWEAWFRHRLRR